MRRSIIVLLILIAMLMMSVAVMADHVGGTATGASTTLTVNATIDVYQWYDVGVSFPPVFTNQTLIATSPNVYNPHQVQFVFSVTSVYSNSATVDVAVKISNSERAGNGGLGDFESSLKPHIISFEYAAYTYGNLNFVPYSEWHKVKGGTPSNTEWDFMQLTATQNNPDQGNGMRYYMAARFKPDYNAPAGKYPVAFTIRFQAYVKF